MLSLKQFSIVFVLSISLIAPGLASAETAADLQAQIAGLQVQVTSLQAQIAVLQQRLDTLNQGGYNLHDGDRVKSLVNLTVRSTPGTTAGYYNTGIIARAVAGSTGTIRCNLSGSPSCPASVSGYTWWYIDWDGSIPTGWSAQGAQGYNYLVKL